MRILVFSDTHGRYDRMIKAAERTDFDTVIFLGDCLRDFDSFARSVSPDKMCICVKGNCDGFDGTPEERVVTFEGKKILILHGHTRNVKYGKDTLMYYAESLGCDIVLYGHTHICDNTYVDAVKPYYLFNPGTLAGKRGPSTYGYIEIINDKIITNIVDYKEI